jgi:cytochrome c oxidase assembly protein Cox11
MAGHPYYTLGGSDTVEVSELVVKGQGVEVDPDEPTKVRPWSAGSTRRAGVAQIGGNTLASNAVDNFAPSRRLISVMRGPIGTRMVYAAAAQWREPLIAAANGQVTPAGAAPDFATVVGYCDEPGGVLAGGTARVQLIG